MRMFRLRDTPADFRSPIATSVLVSTPRQSTPSMPDLSSAMRRLLRSHAGPRKEVRAPDTPCLSWELPVDLPFQTLPVRVSICPRQAEPLLLDVLLQCPRMV